MPTGPAYGRPDEIEPGISRFRVWSFGPSRNDEIQRAQAEIAHQHFSPPLSGSVSASSISEGWLGSQAANWRLESSRPNAGHAINEKLLSVSVGNDHAPDAKFSRDGAGAGSP